MTDADREPAELEDDHAARLVADRWSDLGEFIRQQRSTARLSLRRLSELAGISNPYLSQIERGLRKPSADILQQIAKALRISAETLYVRAGILEARGDEGGLVRHILAEPGLTEEQRQVLVRIYLSFLHENERTGDADAGSPPEA
ncbi:MAG TPA: helix-turn-helix transcriptional regulator [Acidimicrobiales bacterium]|nr:helix-turn-helix transcriptional regulator [Acidimicrobiales bacterium]